MHDSKRRRVRRATGGILHAVGGEEEEEEELGICRIKFWRGNMRIMSWHGGS